MLQSIGRRGLGPRNCLFPFSVMDPNTYQPKSMALCKRTTLVALIMLALTGAALVLGS